MFETTGTVNKEFFDVIKAFILPSRTKYVLIFMIVFASLFSAFTFFIKDYKFTVIFLVFIVLMFLEYHLLRSKTIKVNLKRMAETTGKEEVEYTVSFEEDGVVAENHSTGASAKMTFDRFVILAKFDSVYVLFTKTHQFIPIFVNCLNNSEKDKLLSFLETHIPNLK